MKRFLYASILTALPCVVNAEMVYTFSNPSFNGMGYSSHVLGIEQLQYNRQKDIDDALQAEADRIANELENSVLNKFIRNLESRIYATISKQMVDNMFAECEPTEPPTCVSSTTGSAEIEGATITWHRDLETGSITLIVDGPDGYTEITIPGAGEFSF